MDYQWIGTSPVRFDTPDKAMGRALYTADYTAPDMLHVVLVRSQHAHGRLLAVEVPPLEEGTFCFTAKDLPHNLLPSVMNDQPVLAEDHIRYEGEPVAIVAAPTLEKARELAGQVKLRVSPLPVVEDMRLALAEDAPKLFPQGNLCSEFHSCKGDPDGAFPGCALVLEETYHMPVQIHGFLEPEAAFTCWDESGRLALISSTQNAFADRGTIAAVLGLDPERITSRAATVGGAFGGKDGNTAQIFAAVVTWYTKRPAKLVFTREENIRYGMKRHNACVHVKLGFTGEGRLEVFDGEMWMDTGAYAILGPAVLGLGTEHMTGPYHVPHVRLNSWLAYTNHAPASAMRGFGAPQTAMAVESLMNLAAEKLGLTPLEIRLRNAIHRGQPGPMGALMEHSVGFEEALRQFAESDFYKEMTEHPEPGCGYGMAAGMMSSGMGKHVPDTATAEIERIGSDKYRVRVGLVDIGQGSQTVLGMIAAEALGVPLPAVEVVMGDTEQTTDGGSTAASRTTYVCGNAVLQAAEQIRAGADRARASFAFPEIPGEDGVHAIFGFIVQGAKVRVNPVTGAVHVLSVHNTTEAGRIIHPEMMAGQIFGGIAMSTGYAVSEQIRYRDGHAMEDSFSNYVMPTAMDAPSMTSDDVPFSEESGPYGAKGVAEASTVALAPAVSAAVRQLCPGLHITTLPIDREEVLRACHGRSGIWN